MQVAAQESHPVDRAPKSVGVELRKNLMAVDLLDNERHDEHDRRPHRTQGGHQGRRRGRTVQIDDPGPHREGVDHADRTLVGVRKRQHRQKDILAADREDGRRHIHLGTQRLVRQHHPLGFRGRTRRIDDDRQIVRRRNGRRACGAHPLGDDSQILGADHDMEPLDGPFRKFREEFIGNKQRLGLRVLDDHVELLTRKIGKNRYGDHARRRYGKIADAPVGHVAAQQCHLVSGPETRFGQDLLHPTDPAPYFGVRQLVAVVHGKSDSRCEALRAVTNQVVQSVDRHVKIELASCE